MNLIRLRKYIRGEKVKGNRIKSASIDVTYKCNFRCLHCFNSSGEHCFEKEELSEDEILGIAKQLSEFELESLCFCGGEPLLKKEAIYKAARYLKENASPKLSLNMVTNGYLMTEEIADKLKESGIKLIQISLDGYDAEAHDWLRNYKGAFDKAVEAIKIVVSKGFYVGVAYTPTKKSIKYIDKLIDFCETLGVKQFRAQPIMSLGRAELIRDYFLDYTDYLKLSDKLKRRNINSSMIIEWGDPLQHIIGARCEAPEIDYLTIGGYGDLLISPYLPVTFGNIRRHTIKEYLDHGLTNVWQYEFLKEISKVITVPTNMNISKINSKVPKIFQGYDIDFDLIEKDTEKLNYEIVKKII
ncbi:radical SAM protein [Thermoanaerobacterium thermosaccharolyticum]|nr:radical SAM protein [Thermoanaerobacterium thermosaccharolyticum]